MNAKSYNVSGNSNNTSHLPNPTLVAFSSWQYPLPKQPGTINSSGISDNNLQFRNMLSLSGVVLVAGSVGVVVGIWSSLAFPLSSVILVLSLFICLPLCFFCFSEGFSDSSNQHIMFHFLENSSSFCKKGKNRQTSGKSLAICI